MPTFTIYRPTSDTIETTFLFDSIQSARQSRMSYSKLNHFKRCLSRENVEETFHMSILAIECGILHPAALIEAIDISDVFKITNIATTKMNSRLNESWLINEEVTIIDNPEELAMYSTSVGDIISTQSGKKYIVTPHTFLSF